MSLSDFRGARLRALDVRLGELIGDGTTSPCDVDDQAEALCDLAAAIAGSMSSWNEVMRRVSVEPSSPFEPRLAGLLTIESVFDALLDGPSLAVLTAAYELAATAP